MTPASERSRTGLATVRSPHLPDAAPKAARALWTGRELCSDRKLNVIFQRSSVQLTDTGGYPPL